MPNSTVAKYNKYFEDEFDYNNDYQEDNICGEYEIVDTMDMMETGEEYFKAIDIIQGEAHITKIIDLYN